MINGSFFQSVYDGFWDETFWFPPNITWSTLSPPSNDENTYTSGRDLVVPAVVACVFVVTQLFLDRVCFLPVASYLGIKSTRRKEAQPNRFLEKFYKQRRAIGHEQIVGLAKQLDWTERQVERWLRVRRAQDKPTTLAKFTETAWRFVFYTCSFCLGAYALWDEPWATDAKKLILSPPHAISPECWWYCMITCGFYCSLLLSYVLRGKRFLEMKQLIAHHFVVLGAITLAWLINGHRVLCVGLFVYDFSDICLEMLRLARYARLQRTSTILFVLMTLSWVATRCLVYPFWFLRMSLFESLDIYPLSRLYLLINAILLVMFVLNTYWSYFIVRTCVKWMYSGPQYTRRTRSSQEDISEESAQEQTQSLHRKKTKSIDVPFELKYFTISLCFTPLFGKIPAYMVQDLHAIRPEVFSQQLKMLINIKK